MALIFSDKKSLGFKLPAFHLQSIDGKSFSSLDLKSYKALLVMFICNHCPYVKAIEDRIISLYREMPKEEAQFIGICSNDYREYPEDSPQELFKSWTEKGYGFPYLVDESQEVAKSFGAVCTPDFFLFNQSQELVYRGRLDDSWKDEKQVKVQELKTAIQLLLRGENVPVEQSPSMGCSIKWKKQF